MAAEGEQKPVELVADTEAAELARQENLQKGLAFAALFGQGEDLGTVWLDAQVDDLLSKPSAGEVVTLDIKEQSPVPLSELVHYFVPAE